MEMEMAGNWQQSILYLLSAEHSHYLDFDRNMSFPWSWWKLGPREDSALEVGQWSVCLFESKEKKTLTIQCVTVTAIHSTRQEWQGYWKRERKHHLPSKIIMESVIGTSLIGDVHVWWVWTLAASLQKNQTSETKLTGLYCIDFQDFLRKRNKIKQSALWFGSI